VPDKNEAMHLSRFSPGMKKPTRTADPKIANPQQGGIVAGLARKAPTQKNIRKPAFETRSASLAKRPAVLHQKRAETREIDAKGDGKRVAAAGRGNGNLRRSMAPSPAAEKKSIPSYIRNLTCSARQLAVGWEAL